MKRLTLLAAVLAAAAACDAPTAPAVPAASASSGPSAAVVENDRSETPVVAFNECSGETIAGTATFHDVYAVTTTPSGTFHIAFSEKIAFEGSTPTTEYVGSQVGAGAENLAAGEAINSISHLTLVSKGSAPNVLMQFSYHLTITPNGDVTVYRYDFVVKCTG